MSGAPVILWLRQDLRLADQAALSAAAAAGPVLALYILDDETPGRWRWGGASRWWLHHSLQSLSQALPLVLRRGRAERVIEAVAAQSGAKAIYFTRDYAPWAPALEMAVKALCARRGMECHRFGGALLHQPETIRSGAGEPYQVYTPFSRACFAAGEPKPARPIPAVTRWTGELASDRLSDWALLPTSPDWAAGFAPLWTPGEAGAQGQLSRFLETGLTGYADQRDRPAGSATSRLSPHLHWGEISPAQCWRAVRHAMAAAGGRLDQAGQKFLQELLWREFSYHLLHHWPGLPDQPFKPEFTGFPWASNPQTLSAWQRGETGYPMIDAGMRELWVTGIMHNRVRMVAASFLTKHLLIAWQAGQAWFWDTLVDADLANNSASWQWMAGCGADAAPYFRIFNPVLQGEKFDPDGVYIRRWLPELAGLDNEVIHRPWLAPVPPRGYPKPLVDHGFARARALQAYQQLRSARPL